MSTTTSAREGEATNASQGGHRLGLVSCCRELPTGTAVTVLAASGRSVEVTLDARVDQRAGAGLASCFRRLSWARITLTDAGPRAALSGVRHRLPVTVDVPVDAVLGLVGRGVPTLVVAA